MDKILLVNGHQKQGNSAGRLNRTLCEQAERFFRKHGCDVRTTAIDGPYSISGEVAKIAWADAILFFTPVYWMSIPWGTKKYIDEVYMAGMGTLSTGDGRKKSDPEHGYGTGGLLKGKRYMLITTWNAPRGAFNDQSQFFEGKSVDDVFFHFHKAQQFLGLSPLESFSCHDVNKNPHIEADLAGFEAHLMKVFGGELAKKS